MKIESDTIIFISGGPIERYWAKLEPDGTYHKISPDILYIHYGSDIITFYPDKDLSKWTQAIKNSKTNLLYKLILLIYY